jgi:hypothetical protein
MLNYNNVSFPSIHGSKTLSQWNTLFEEQKARMEAINDPQERQAVAMDLEKSTTILSQTKLTRGINLTMRHFLKEAGNVLHLMYAYNVQNVKYFLDADDGSLSCQLKMSWCSEREDHIIRLYQSNPVKKREDLDALNETIFNEMIAVKTWDMKVAIDEQDYFLMDERKKDRGFLFVPKTVQDTFKPHCSNHDLCPSFGEGRMKLLWCSSCKLKPYCSRECQKTDWSNHKEECKRATLKNKESRDLQQSTLIFGKCVNESC